MLFLNATDLDRSREYGQESIIYSLEGSFLFRISARSGEPAPALRPSSLHLGSAREADSRPAQGPTSHETPVSEQASFEHLASSLKCSFQRDH